MKMLMSGGIHLSVLVHGFLKCANRLLTHHTYVICPPVLEEAGPNVREQLVVGGPAELGSIDRTGHVRTTQGGQGRTGQDRFPQIWIGQN